MAGNSAEAGRSVTSKITAILVLFNQGTEYSMTEIAGLTRLPISTAHRFTTELAARGLLERTNDARSRAGAALQVIGSVRGCPPTVSERAPCVLDDLAAVTQTRARLGRLQGTAVSYIEKHPGLKPVTSFSAGATLPVHPTALGRALLAFSPVSTVEMTILRGLRPYTAHTITAPARFRRALAVTRLTRVAITRGELEVGVSTVAMPVFGPDGDLAAAIELTITNLDDDLQPVMTALAVAARSLSRELRAGTRLTRAAKPPAETVRMSL